MRTPLHQTSPYWLLAPPLRTTRVSLMDLDRYHGRLAKRPFWADTCCPLVRRRLQTEENRGSAEPAARPHWFLRQPAASSSPYSSDLLRPSSLFLFFLETYFPSVSLYLLLLRYKFGSCLWITCPSHQLTSWLSTARDDLCPWLNASCVFRQLSTFHNWVTLSTLSGLLIFSNRTVPNKYFENISRDVNFIGLDRKY